MGKPEFICPPTMRPHVERVLRGEYASPGDQDILAPRILDIGANLGSFAIWATQQWPGCALTCYEPHPVTFWMLCKNVTPWPITDCRREAVTARSGALVTLYGGRNNCGEASTLQGEEQSSESHRVTNTHAAKLPACDILKIDAEGVELEILRAYPHLDACKLVLLEAHGVDDRADLLTMFDKSIGVHKFDKNVDARTMDARWTMAFRRSES